jgi:hypothetical protein
MRPFDGGKSTRTALVEPLAGRGPSMQPIVVPIPVSAVSTANLQQNFSSRLSALAPGPSVAASVAQECGDFAGDI